MAGENANEAIAQQLTQTLTDVVGLTVAQANFVYNQGITTATLLARLDDETFKELLDRNTLANIIITTKMRFRALRHWLQEKKISHELIDLNTFTNEKCDATLDEMAKTSSLKGASKGGTSQKDVKPPEKFSGKIKSWKAWKAEFESYLAQLTGADGCPLSYIIRNDDKITEEEYDQMEGQVKRIYDAPLQGDYYDRDNFQVFQKLRALLTGGLAETYLTDYERSGDGREAWNTVLIAYEGDDAKNAAITSARNDIRQCTWERNSKNWTFDQYCLKHIRAHNILKRYDVPMDETTKVREFLRGIHNTSFQPIKTTILLNPEYKQDLNKAITAFKDTVTTLDLVLFDKNQDDRKIGAVQTRGGPGRHFNNRGGRGGRGGHKRSYDNNHHCGGGRGGYQGGRHSYHGRYSRGGGRGNHYSNASNREDDGLLLDPSVLNQMNSKQRAAYYEGRKKLRGQDGNETGSEIPRNIGAVNTDNNARVNNANTDPDDTSRITSASAAFGRSSDHNIPSSRSFNTDRRSQGAIHSGLRRISFVNHRNKIPENYTFRGRAEIDSRADTTCAGAAFALIETTGQECDVAGFHDEMNTLKNIPVATCATAYDHPELQETLILLFHEALYFGKDMEHSLINPNHGVYVPEHEVTLPFRLHGCISYIPIRLPNANELKSCRYIEMTSERTWEPYSDSFQESENPFALKTEASDNLRASRNIGAAVSTDRRCDIDAVTLSERLGISHYLAQETLKSTTQLATRNVTEPFTKRLRTRQSQLRYPRINDFLYSDTFFSTIPSKPRNNSCAQMFVTSKGFCDVYPMKTKGEAGDKLNQFITSVGIPLGLVTDGAKEENLGRWEEVRKKFLLPQRTTEPHTPQQNRCEIEIRETKDHFRHLMDRKKVPEELWDFGIKYTTDIRKIIARPNLDHRLAYEVLTGNTPDISNLLDFEFYEWIKFFEPTSFPASREVLGRWLGQAHDVGQALCYYILKENGQVVARSSVRRLTPTEISDANEIKSSEEFDRNIKSNIGSYDSEQIHSSPNDELEEEMAPSNTDDAETAEKPEQVSTETPPIPNEPADITHGPDSLINAQLFIARGDRSALATVKHRKRNIDGNLIGRKHKIPTLDSRVYVCEFEDGETCDVSYNTIAEHLYSQCDSEGNQYQIFREIINHRRKKNAIDKSDQMIRVGGKLHKKKTTTGWDLEVEWRDGSTSWLSLKEMKNSNAVDVAEYAKANRIDDEPAFDWWVHEVLKRRDRLIKMARSHRLKTGYKFGIRVPDTVEEAIEMTELTVTHSGRMPLKKKCKTFMWPSILDLNHNHHQAIS